MRNGSYRSYSEVERMQEKLDFEIFDAYDEDDEEKIQRLIKDKKLYSGVDYE